MTPKRHGDSEGSSPRSTTGRTGRARVSTSNRSGQPFLSAAIGTLRGLHFQTPPFAQAKLIRAGRGRIFDVAVDIRRSSPTFGKYVGVELSAENWRQLLVPIGFAHGFVTLGQTPRSCTRRQRIVRPADDSGSPLDDRHRVARPLPAAGPTLSDKERRCPRLRERGICSNDGLQSREPKDSVDSLVERRGRRSKSCARAAGLFARRS